MSVTATARIATERGERYRKQLASHFGNKIEVAEEPAGTVLRWGFGGTTTLTVEAGALVRSTQPRGRPDLPGDREVFPRQVPGTDDPAVVADQEVDTPVRWAQLCAYGPVVLDNVSREFLRGLVGPGTAERHLLRRVYAAQRHLRQFVQALIVIRTQRQPRGAQ